MTRAHNEHPPPAHSGSTGNRPIRRASVTAGVALLALTALAVFANFLVLERLVTQGDPAGTSADILASEGIFRRGIVGWVLVVVLDVVIAWALLEVFAPVSQNLSRLAAWFRLAYAGVLMVAVSHLVGVPSLLHGQEYLSAFSTDQLQAQALLNVSTFNDVYDAALVLFGAHLLLIGYLAFRSGYVPRLLGVLIAIAGFGYIFDSFAEFLTQGSAISIGQFTFVGEFLLALWLLIRGRRLSLDTSEAKEDQGRSLAQRDHVIPRGEQG